MTQKYEDWKAFDPGFEHGEVEVRRSNVEGTFSAANLRDLQGADVREPNTKGGQVGDESFDWSSVDLKGADVRVAAIKGQLGGSAFDWDAVDLQGADVRRSNFPDNIDGDALEGVNLQGADVRRPNVDGQIGDAAFSAVVAAQQTPLGAGQLAWRLGLPPLALALPLVLLRSTSSMVLGEAADTGMLVARALLSGAVALGVAYAARLAARNVVIVKQGTLTFAQFFENGATHVLQAGIHPVASIGTTTKTFNVTEDRMAFGTVSLIRVRPGTVGLGRQNGNPVLLLPGQHLYNEPNFELLEYKSISENKISNGPLHLIRVPPATLGCAKINKRPVLLDSGMHLIYSPGLEWGKNALVSVNEPVIQNGPINIIRVMPGHVGLATFSKTPALMGVGLHFINDPAMEWLYQASVSENVIVNGPISLVRVEPSTVGLATINKQPVILDAGVHIMNEPSMEYLGPRSVNDDLIENGPVNIVRVQPGTLGKATMNGAPLLLDVGVHFVHEPSFVFKGAERVDQPLIRQGPLHVITVPKGTVAPVVVNGEGHFLLEGRYFVEQARLVLKSSQSLTDEYVCAGTRHRIVVPRGKLGLALEGGEPVLYEPGSVHLVNSALFEYRGSVDVTQQLVEHGSLKIVTVKDGQVGVTYDNGALELFKTGRHTITNATHTLAGFVSTGQDTLRISEVSGMTLDNVELTFDAAICIRVVDAQKAVVMLTSGTNQLVEQMQANIQERARLDLSTIIGKNAFNKKHTATIAEPAAAAAALDGAPEDAASQPPQQEEGGDGFRSAVHDKFMSLFKDEMLTECGVEVINMAIEDVRIADHELAKALASAAVANSALEKQTIDAEVVQVKASAEAKVAMIDAEGEAAAMKIRARAEADRIKTISDALEQAGEATRQQEVIKSAGRALSKTSTVLLAQDTGALAMLLGGAQGSRLTAPVI